jgi:hypothetical protein
MKNDEDPIFKRTALGGVTGWRSMFPSSKNGLAYFLNQLRLSYALWY